MECIKKEEEDIIGVVPKKREILILPFLVSSGARTRWGLFFVKTYKEYMKYETGWLHSGRNLRIIRKHV